MSMNTYDKVNDRLVPFAYNNKPDKDNIIKTRTNRKWIDGKPVYVCDMYVYVTYTGGWERDITDLKIDNIIDIKMSYARRTPYRITSPYITSNTSYVMTRVTDDGTNVKLTYRGVGNDKEIVAIRVQIFYTKKTDKGTE